jgi:pantoate--beta-alanine ligase
MFFFETRSGLRNKLAEFRKGKSIGFVPTMGALHEGHLSLVRKAITENSIVVVSIFVNPTQFNDPDDLRTYPRNLDTDLELLEASGCHIVFVPAEKEIYPRPDERVFDFGVAGKVMEGKYRKGHFNGVAQVVSILFEIVEPDKAYFGLKDFQQFFIINKLVDMLDLPVEIVGCPIVREKNGLALSSRNELLSPEEHENAALIYKTLTEVNNQKGKKSVKDITDWVVNNINKNPFLNVEYFEIVDYDSLQPIKSWEDKGIKVACIAVYCGKVRLIDNLILN